jgi:hypothetical protein
MLTLIKEDGSGKANANSYASRADGDAYHEGRLYSTAWTGASQADQEKALVMATSLIDAYMEFGGRKATGGQALQWPRWGCPDRDGAALGGLDTLDSNAVPACVVAATCEMARELIVTDRTAAPLGEGLVSSKVGDSAMKFDRLGRAPVLSHVTIALLQKVGNYVGGGSGAVRLVRA